MVIKKLMIPIVGEMKVQREHDMPEEMKYKCVVGDFVRLEHVKQYCVDTPRYIYERLIDKLSERYNVELYERRIEELNGEILELKRRLWRAERPAIIRILSLGLYDLWNPYRDKLSEWEDEGENSKNISTSRGRIFIGRD